MGLFQQSSLTYAAAKQAVARSAGHITDTDLNTMAAMAICQAIEKWNNKKAWSFLTTVAPTFSIDSSLGADYLLPPDFLGFYSVRTTTTAKRNLSPTSQREYDWADPYGMTGQPMYYSAFNQGNLGKVRFYPTPSVYDTIDLKYYRKLALPMEALVVANCVCPLARKSLSGTSVTGSRDLTLSSTSGLYVGELVSHSGFASGVTISDIKSSTVVTISAAATSSATATATIGGVIMTMASTGGIRNGAAVSGTSVASGTTVYRVIDATTVHLSTPVSAAITAGSITFSSDAQLLDIPADYERGIISLAKYYYLRDKGGDEERIKGWKQESMEAFQEAMARDNTNTDEQQGFQPGYLAPNDVVPSNPNDFRWAFTDWA